MKGLILAFGVGGLLATGQSWAQELNCRDISSEPSAGSVRFDQDVLPVLQLSALGCVNCHAASASVDLSLDQNAEASHDQLYCEDTVGTVPDPIGSGKRVVPGAPMESWLYLRVACSDPSDSSFNMPRNSETVFLNELRIIYDWIEQGAPSADTIFTSRFDTRGYCS